MIHLMFAIGFLVATAFLLGLMLGGSCTAKTEYEYQKKLRRFKIRCDFEDWCREYEKNNEKTISSRNV